MHRQQKLHFGEKLDNAPGCSKSPSFYHRNGRHCGNCASHSTLRSSQPTVIIIPVSQEAISVGQVPIVHIHGVAVLHLSCNGLRHCDGGLLILARLITAVGVGLGMKIKRNWYMPAAWLRAFAFHPGSMAGSDL